MVSMNILSCKNRKEWRNWLFTNFKLEKEIWLSFPLSSYKEESVSYNDAVEEALCVGWIDGIAKSLDKNHQIYIICPMIEESEVMELNNNEHMVKPAMVFISDSTEIGTIYTRKELLDLRETCDKYGLYLYLDGARLGSALTSASCDYEPSFLGHVLDAFYVGGTKNGLLFGEALIVVNEQLQKDFRYAIKNKGAMLAKGYAVGIEFEEAFKDGLYFDIARATNEVADYLKDKLGISNKEQPTNQIFIKLDNKKAQEVIDKFGTEMWNKGKNESEIRIVISFITTKKDVDELIAFLN